MKILLIVLVSFFAVFTTALANSVCPWCHGTGTYNAPAINYTSEGTYHKCALCEAVYSSRIGHSCRCRKCNGTGYLNSGSTPTTPQRTTDYSNDIFFQNIDWNKASTDCLYTNPCRLVVGKWTDRNTAFAQFQICQPMQNSMYQWYGSLVDQLASMKATELTKQYGRKITSVIELYDCKGNLLRRTVR